MTYPAKISLLSCENFIEKAQNLASSGLKKWQVKPKQFKIFQGKRALKSRVLKKAKSGPLGALPILK